MRNFKAQLAAVLTRWDVKSLEEWFKVTTNSFNLFLPHGNTASFKPWKEGEGELVEVIFHNMSEPHASRYLNVNSSLHGSPMQVTIPYEELESKISKAEEYADEYSSEYEAVKIFLSKEEHEQCREPSKPHQMFEYLRGVTHSLQVLRHCAERKAERKEAK